MFTVPAAIPDNIPFVAPIPAIAPLLLVHVPPVIVFAKVIVVPGHKVNGPVIAGAYGLTVIGVAIWHPVLAKV